MHKILAFGASSSRNSINKTFAQWAASQVSNAEIRFIDLNDYEMPIYSIDREKEDGVPEPAHRFKQYLKESDGVLMSFAEHNGSYTAAFKNVFDWMSRLEKPIWLNKPVFLSAVAPGGRGASAVLEGAVAKFPYQGAVVTGSFSLPFYADNFSQTDGITDAKLAEQFQSELKKFEDAIQGAAVEV